MWSFAFSPSTNDLWSEIFFFIPKIINWWVDGRKAQEVFLKEAGADGKLAELLEIAYHSTLECIQQAWLEAQAPNVKVDANIQPETCEPDVVVPNFAESRVQAMAVRRQYQKRRQTVLVSDYQTCQTISLVDVKSKPRQNGPSVSQSQQVYQQRKAEERQRDQKQPHEGEYIKLMVNQGSSQVLTTLVRLPPA